MLAEGALAIHLICTGGAGHARAHSRAGSVRHVARRAGYGEEVAIDIEGDVGRIRPPEEVKPPIHSGGDKDGWWRLKALRLGEDRISARFTMNFLNSPTVAIDRITGHILIDGHTGRFSGTCAAYDPATVQRRF